MYIKYAEAEGTDSKATQRKTELACGHGAISLCFRI